MQFPLNFIRKKNHFSKNISKKPFLNSYLFDQENSYLFILFVCNDINVITPSVQTNLVTLTLWASLENK